MHFPPSQIFGRTLVPVYYWENEPTIPLEDIARATGIPFKMAFDVVSSNREILNIIDSSTCKPIGASASLSSLSKRLCLGIDGIGILIFSLDHNRIKDRDIKERIMIAKRWLIAQVSSRLKVMGKRNQPRWDAGLSKEQSRELKKYFVRQKKKK